MEIEKLTLENLSENGWIILKDLTKSNCRVYENWKDTKQKFLYCFYKGEQKGVITQTPWNFK